PSDTGTTTGSFRAWLNASTLARQLEASETLTYSFNSFAADANAKGAGLNTTSLAPYLKPLDLEPTLQDVSLAASAKLTIAQRGNATVASLDLSGVQLRDG